MENEGQLTMFESIVNSIKEKLDLFVRFMRSKWLAYTFIAAYVIMLATLIIMVCVMVSYFIGSHTEPEPKVTYSDDDVKISPFPSHVESWPLWSCGLLIFIGIGLVISCAVCREVMFRRTQWEYSQI